MAMWSTLQHNWPWPIVIYQAIDTRETITINATLAISPELQTVITRVDQ